MTAFPEILEQRPPRAARDDETGLTASRQFSVIAQSDVGAIVRMRSYGIFRGAVFRTPTGQVPDAYCLCQSIEAVGKPPAVNGGYGQYIVTADYSQAQKSPGPIPGGPTRWSVKASLVSTPVDIDAMGHMILSSSLEPPDPPITALKPEEMLHGDFYFAAPDELTAYKIFRPFNGKINDKLVTSLGADRGSLLIHPFQTVSCDTGWVRMSVDIQYRPSKTLQDGKSYEGWDDVFPDRGLLETADATSKDPKVRYRRARDAQGNSFARPMPLDGSGNLAQLLSAVVGDAPPVNTKLKVVKNYLYADFSKIPLP